MSGHLSYDLRATQVGPRVRSLWRRAHPAKGRSPRDPAGADGRVRRADQSADRVLSTAARVGGVGWLGADRGRLSTTHGVADVIPGARMIILKTPDEIATIARAARLVAETLEMLRR